MTTESNTASIPAIRSEGDNPQGNGLLLGAASVGRTVPGVGWLVWRQLGEIVGINVSSLIVGRSVGVLLVSPFDALSDGFGVGSVCIVSVWLGGLDGPALGREVGSLVGFETSVGNSVGTGFEGGVLVGDWLGIIAVVGAKVGSTISGFSVGFNVKGSGDEGLVVGLVGLRERVSVGVIVNWGVCAVGRAGPSEAAGTLLVDAINTLGALLGAAFAALEGKDNGMLMNSSETSASSVSIARTN